MCSQLVIIMLATSLNRLYVCAQFVIINCMLRRHPPDLFAAFADGGNLLSTTIHVLVSAVRKLSQSVRIAEGTVLYRGLGGLMELPASFYRADGRGCSGFAEWGFMSTTRSKEVALGYSGVKEKRPAPTALVMRTSAVDRGACIRDYSQHPQVGVELPFVGSESL